MFNDTHNPDVNLPDASGVLEHIRRDINQWGKCGPLVILDTLRCKCSVCRAHYGNMMDLLEDQGLIYTSHTTGEITVNEHSN